MSATLKLFDAASTALEAQFRSHPTPRDRVILLNAESAVPSVTVAVAKQWISELNSPAKKWPLAIDLGKHGVRLIPTKPELMKIQNESIEHSGLKWTTWLREKPITANELAAALRVSRHVANKLLKQGEEKNLLRKLSDNRWVALKESA